MFVHQKFNTMSQDNGYKAVESTKNRESNQLNAIRDILFGQNMVQYAEEFQHIRTLINEHQQTANSSLNDRYEELLDKMSQLEARLSAQMNKNQQELLAAIEQLQANKQDRKTLGTLLIEMGRQIQE